MPNFLDEIVDELTAGNPESQMMIRMARRIRELEAGRHNLFMLVNAILDEHLGGECEVTNAALVRAPVGAPGTMELPETDSVRVVVGQDHPDVRFPDVP